MPANTENYPAESHRSPHSRTISVKFVHRLNLLSQTRIRARKFRAVSGYQQSRPKTSNEYMRGPVQKFPVNVSFRTAAPFPAPEPLPRIMNFRLPPCLSASVKAVLHPHACSRRAAS